MNFIVDKVAKLFKNFLKIYILFTARVSPEELAVRERWSTKKKFYKHSLGVAKYHSRILARKSIWE